MTNGLSPANLVARSAAFARALAFFAPPPPDFHPPLAAPAHRPSPRTRVRSPQSPHPLGPHPQSPRPQSPQRPLRRAAHCRGLASGRRQPCAPPTALRAAAG